MSGQFLRHIVNQYETERLQRLLVHVEFKHALNFEKSEMSSVMCLMIRMEPIPFGRRIIAFFDPVQIGSVHLWISVPTSHCKAMTRLARIHGSSAA